MAGFIVSGLAHWAHGGDNRFWYDGVLLCSSRLSDLPETFFVSRQLLDIA